MNFNLPRNDDKSRTSRYRNRSYGVVGYAGEVRDKISWTKHSKEKMRFYQLSVNRLKRILRHPQRTEQGVALNTVASMQRAGSKKHPTEIWIMYRYLKDKSVRIISAWRYPGISPKGEPIPIPEDILKELKELTKV